MNRRGFIKSVITGLGALVIGEGLAKEKKLPVQRQIIHKGSSMGWTEIPEILKAEGIEWVKYKKNVWQFRYAGLMFFAYPLADSIVIALHIPDDKPRYNYAVTYY